MYVQAKKKVQKSLKITNLPLNQGKLLNLHLALNIFLNYPL